MDSSWLDPLVMLLSTDWFFPHWERLDIEIPYQAKKDFQQGCREIVQQIIGGAKIYWNISFSAERVKATLELLDELLSRCKIATPASHRIHEIVGGGSTQGGDNKKEWFVMSVMERIAQQNADLPSVFNPEIARKVALLLASWEESVGNRRDDLERESLEAPSSWDKQILQLTPDLPTMLANFVWDLELLEKYCFVKTQAKSHLTPVERKELVTYMRSTGERESIPREILPIPAEWLD